MIRLDALLARNLACSRTAAARLLKEGRVTDRDGRVLGDRRHDLGEMALPLSVFVDGQPHWLVASAHLMLNKPAGFVTALRDPVHRTAYELLQDAPLFPELRPVGRLDLDTTGLLLWTTEGAWVQRLTHPKRKVPRTYQAALARPHAPLPDQLVLDDGHQPAIVALGPLQRADLHPSLVVAPDSAAFASITVIGGAYHEVRRIFAALGSHVLGLCRVGFGELTLPPELPPGRYRAIELSLPATPSSD